MSKRAQLGNDKPQALQYAFGSIFCSVIAALLLLAGLLLLGSGYGFPLIIGSIFATPVAVCLAIPALVSKNIPGKLKSTVVVAVGLLLLSIIILLIVVFWCGYSGIFNEQ